jgi:hypothetical protein
LSGSGVRSKVPLVLAVGCVLLSIRIDAAEKQLKPFIAVTFGGGTTFVNLEEAAAKPKLAIGIGAAMLWDLVGFDVDLAHAPGFFQAGHQALVIASSVTTITGNVVVTLPRRMTEYALRPYFVGGAGFMRVRIDDVFGALRVRDTLATIDVGGGATGFVTDTWGLCWDVRYFRGFSDAQVRGVSFGPERLSFWRASMAIVLR